MRGLSASNPHTALLGTKQLKDILQIVLEMTLGSTLSEADLSTCAACCCEHDAKICVKNTSNSVIQVQRCSKHGACRAWCFQKQQNRQLRKRVRKTNPHVIGIIVLHILVVLAGFANRVGWLIHRIHFGYLQHGRHVAMFTQAWKSSPLFLCCPVPSE